MLLPSVVMLGAQLLTPVSDSVPLLNVEPVCQGIAMQGGSSFHDPAVAKEKQDCLHSEQEVRDELIKRWSTFSATDKNSCVNESRMGGDSSYTELLTCLEMARDVRNLGSEQENAAAPRARRKR